MSIKKCFKTAFTFVATMVGAGFISGQEIALYFAETSLIVPIIGGVASGLLCLLFTVAGSVTNGKMLEFTFGKGATVSSFVIRQCNLITMCAMIAGSEYIVFTLFGFCGGGIISAIFSLVFVCFGIEKLKLLNTCTMPLILLLLIWVFIESKENVPSFSTIKIVSPLLYAGMNMLSAGVLTAKVSVSLSRKECLLSSVIAAATLTALIVVIYLTIQKCFDKTMPFLYAADKLGMSVVAGIITYIAIFTTLVGSHYIAGNGKKTTAVICTAVGFLLSPIGFKRLVNTFYPIMGLLGIALTFCVLIRFAYVLIKKRSIDNLDVFRSDKIDDLRRNRIQVTGGKR